MKQTKAQRRTAAFLAAVLAGTGLSLTGCHGSRGLDPFVMPEKLDTSRPCEITFWAKNDTNKTQTEIYEQAIASFEEYYPNITVNMRLYTNYGRIYNDVITNISTQTTPNVCITYPDHIATYRTGTNVVVPLDDLLADPVYGPGGTGVLFDAPRTEDIVPQFLEEGKIDGVQYALPFMRSTEACYVNKTYVEKLGYTLPDVLTWDFVWEVAEAAAEQEADGTYRLNGQKVMLPFIYKSTDNMMIQMLRQKGAGYATAEGDIELFNDTTKEILHTVAEYTGRGAFSTFKISSYPANFLNAGQCVFAIDSTAGATWMGSQAPLADISEENFVDFETEVMLLPQFDPEHPQMISQGPSVCLFNKKDPQEVLASWLFVQYLLTDEVQMAYASTEGYVPVTEKARQNPAYQAYLADSGKDTALHYDVKIKASELLLAHSEDTFVTPVFNGSASLRDAAGQLVENVTKSVRRGETIDEAYMEALQEDITSLYRLDQTAGTVDSGREELGPLPPTARFLLGALAGTWVLLGGCVLTGWIKKRKKP